MSRTVRRTIGISFWALAAVAAIIAVQWSRSGDGADTDSRVSLVRYLAGPTTKIRLTDPTSGLETQDPVFLNRGEGDWAQVGYVLSSGTGSKSPDLGNEVVIAWYADDLPANQCRFVQYRNSGRLEDVVATMLPPETRLRIQQRLAAAMSEHGDELSAAFVPLVQTSLQRSLPVIEQELRRSVDRHRADIDQLVDKWNDEIVQQRLIPLARAEIVPIIREHGKPTAELIGRELWDRASLWRFGWRLLYDSSRLQQDRKLVQEEWDRFVDEEAIPVFESHMDEVVTDVQRMAVDIAANAAVRSELATVANEMVADPQTQVLVRQVLTETLINNPRLREVWSSVWSSNEARQALNVAGDRMEPVVRSIGDEVFGSEELGINPNFARVLRNQILRKDRRWIVAIPDAAATPVAKSVVPLADESMPYPVVHLADPDSSESGTRERRRGR